MPSEKHESLFMNKAIAISINHFAGGGGMESYTFDLINQLFPQYGKIKVYANKFDETRAEFDKISPVLINQKRIPKKLRPFFFARQLNKIRNNNDYLIACNSSDNADILICGGNHLGYLRGMKKQANLLDKLAIRRNRTNYQTAHKIMAHSQMMARELIELYQVPSEKIHTIYPPADTTRFFPQPDEIARTRQQYGWRDDETVFLFPSTGHQRKGLDLLADFFEHHDLPIKLAVAGSPLPRTMKNVQSLGFCQNMPELYRAADYTIMASRYEPFGLVGIESVLCGTRVVFADNMGCCEVMNDKAGWFFSRENPASLAKAIIQAIELKQQKQHKISHPFDALNYNPSAEQHVRALYQMMDAV